MTYKIALAELREATRALDRVALTTGRTADLDDLRAKRDAVTKAIANLAKEVPK